MQVAAKWRIDNFIDESLVAVTHIKSAAQTIRPLQ